MFIEGVGDLIMGYARPLLIALLLCPSLVKPTPADERTRLRPAPGAMGMQPGTHRPAAKAIRMETAAPLDRVAIAVDGAESSHGQDSAMWRADPASPQGPMQVSEAAATDVGGGDRFDLAQNRAIGRAYLAQLFLRYRNWPDAITAYNWGIGNMDAWVKAGRPPDKFLPGVGVYLRRVLHESGLCDRTAAKAAGRAERKPSAKGSVPAFREPDAAPPDELIYAACTVSDDWTGSQGVAIGPSRFLKKLDQAMRLALLHGARSR